MVKHTRTVNHIELSARGTSGERTNVRVNAFATRQAKMRQPLVKSVPQLIGTGAISIMVSERAATEILSFVTVRRIFHNEPGIVVL